MEEFKKLTSVRTSDQAITYRLDLTSPGMRYFCITCEIILLVAFIYLVSSIPLVGRGLILIITLVVALPTPLSVLLVYGAIASFRKKEIIVDRSTRMVSLTVKFAAMSFKQDIPFDKIEAILLESNSAGPPPGVKEINRAPWVELVVILANGMRMRVVKSSAKKIQPKDVEWLKNEFVRDIFFGTEKPVIFYSERIRIAKSPGVDGETVIEISKIRKGDKVLAIIFAITMTYFAAFFTMVGFFLDLTIISQIGIIISLFIFGPIVLIGGISYGVGKYAKDYIIVNENTGSCTLMGKRGRDDVAINVNDIVATSLTIQRTVIHNRGVTRVFYAYWPTFKIIDGRDLRLYKSDRYIEATSLNHLLIVLIGHAQLKQRNPNVPSLPLLTYDALYKKKETTEGQVIEELAVAEPENIPSHAHVIADSNSSKVSQTRKVTADKVLEQSIYAKGPGKPFSLYCQLCDKWIKMDGDYVIAGDETCKKCGEPMRFMLQCGECGHATFNFVSDYRTIMKSAMTCSECGAKMMLK